MSLARLVITAVVIEGRSKKRGRPRLWDLQVWVQKLVKRFEAEGEAAYWPRPRRPHANPRAVSLGANMGRTVEA